MKLFALVAAVGLLAGPASALTLRATAYCLGPCRRCGTQGRTLTGRRTARGVAVPARLASRRLRLGARVWVQGYGFAVCDDTGGFRRGIDLRFPTHRQAEQWGVRRVRVRVP